MKRLYTELYIFLVTTSILHLTVAGGFLGLLEKLPSSVVPVRYDITLEPNLDEVPASFRGNVTIEIKVFERTSNITLHASKLDINKDDITMKSSNDETIPVSEIKMTSYLETCAIIFQDELKDNEIYELTITYSGLLRHDNQGFYLAKYQDENGVERLFVNTLFMQRNARSAFPCFDEPALKAQFTIKLIHPENYTAVSNEEKISTENLGNGRFLDVFKETCNMSTYLVAFTIFDFKHTSKNAIHQVFATAEAINSGKTEYALEESASTLTSVEDYVDMKFTFSKIDHVVIPKEYFAVEAMENWGLITYNEMVLLFSNETSTSMDEQTALTTMVHEFIHQWFGNLVTPSDWKYLWLSEGFATYLQFRIGDMIKPSWKLLEQFHNIILERSFEGENTFGGESLIDDFQPRWVAYLKAACVIRMTEHFLTPEVFRRGLQIYLKNNQYGAVKPSDLYSALQTAVDEKGAADLLGNSTVADIITTWDSVPYYPIVNVTRDYENGHITFKQNIFGPADFLEYIEDDRERVWYIPINYVLNAKSEEDFAKTTADYWLTENVHTLNGTFTTDGWLIVNKQFTGYYRVNYDLTNWNRLISFLNGPNFQNIHVLNRAQLIDDSFDLAKHGLVEYKIPLSLSTYLSQERNYVCFSSFFNTIRHLNKCLSSSDVYVNFKNYLIDILSGIHKHLGYDESLKEDHLQKLNRANVLKWLCTLGHSECRQTALDKLRKWKVNKTATIPPNLQEPLYCGAMRIGNHEDWDYLFEKYQTATDAAERTRIFNSLSCSENEEVITKFLEKIRDTNNTAIRPVDRTTALVAIIESGNVGLKVTTNYLKQHFRSFWNLVQMDSVLQTIGSRLTTKEELDEFKAFKSQYVGVHMAFRPGIALASMNMEWKRKYLPEITEWLNARGNSNAAA